MRRFLRYFALAVVLAVLAAVGVAGWVVLRPLPQLDGTASLPELRQEVTVDRDAWGVPFIRASSVEDAITAQGYVVAQDRLFQMDLLRRAAAGELSEVIGPATLDLDRENRTLGLRAAAERDVKLLPAERRALLEAYARGVNRFLADHRKRLPWEFTALRYEPRPWSPEDTLLVGAYMYKNLTTTWRWELNRAKVTERVGAERAADLFAVESPLDHFIVGSDVAPAPPRDPRTTRPARKPSGQDSRPALASDREVRGAQQAALAALDAFEEETALFAGSNNWVVDGRHTASGKPLLANDTHLQLSVPCIWYIVHITAPGWNVKGFALPGVPLVIIGQNERIAWGFTNNGADVQDLYIETFNPANPLEYRANGNWVRAEVRKEVIHVKGRPDETLDVVITRHGPVVHSEGGRAYALRWTAAEPGGLAASTFLLGRAHNWDEFLTVCREINGPAQNAVYADVDGNIGFVVSAVIPIRKNGDGSVPVPGDTDDYEWTGYVPFEELPKTLNPPSGMIATANARVVGPGYAHFLTNRWVGPYRTERIYELLGERNNFRPEDFIRLQTDVLSLPHRFLAQELFRASQHARPVEVSAQNLLPPLKGWDAHAQKTSVEMAFVEFTRRALMERLLRPYLGDDWRLYNWFRDGVFLENVLRERPARWLPKEFHSYDDLLMASADDAVRRLQAQSGNPNLATWTWGRFILLQMTHPLVQTGWLARWPGVGPIEQPGAANTVKQTGRSFGPAMRFVADLSNPDKSLMNITLGESGQLGSSHYRDQLPAWFEGRGVPAAFSDAAEENARAHRLRLAPSPN